MPLRTDRALPVHVPAAVFAYYQALAHGATEEDAAAACMATLATVERSRRSLRAVVMPALAA